MTHVNLQGALLAAGAPLDGGVRRLVVAGTTPRLTQSVTRAASATQYTLADMIAQKIEWDLSAVGSSGRLNGATCTLKSASAPFVAPDFKLWLFRPVTDLPFAAAGYPTDNAALTISHEAMRQALIGVLSFSSTGWINGSGAAAAAGDHAWQAAKFAATTADGRQFAPFNLAGLASSTIIGLMQDQVALGWNPTNIAYQFDFVLDADLD